MWLAHRGFTLVEMMITTAISCVMFAALVSVVSKVLDTQRGSTAALRLENEITVVSHTLVREISRSGFLENSAASFIADKGNGMLSLDQFMFLGAHPGEPEASCVLFRYDSDRSGQWDTAAPNELYGFRLRDRAVEMRMDGKACDASGWHDLSDAGEFRFNQLAFELLTTAPPQLRFTISAALAADPTIERTYQYQFPLNNG